MLKERLLQLHGDHVPQDLTAALSSQSGHKYIEVKGLMCPTICPGPSLGESRAETSRTTLRHVPRGIICNCCSVEGMPLMLQGLRRNREEANSQVRRTAPSKNTPGQVCKIPSLRHITTGLKMAMGWMNSVSISTRNNDRNLCRIWGGVSFWTSCSWPQGTPIV